MNKYLVYVIEVKMGTVDVCSTRHGEGYARRMANSRSYEIKERLSGPDELGCARLRWVAHFLRQDYFLLNSKNDQRLARKLFMDGERKRHPGNKNNLKRKSNVDEFTGLPRS